MWRLVSLALLGLTVGSIAHSERRVVVLSVFLGLLYGAAELLFLARVFGRPSVGRVLSTLGLGLVLAAPVYAIGELWRRVRVRGLRWLQRLRNR